MSADTNRIKQKAAAEDGGLISVGGLVCDLEAALTRRIAEWCEPMPTWDYTQEPGIARSPRGFWIAGIDPASGGRTPWRSRYDFTADLNACAEFERKLIEDSVMMNDDGDVRVDLDNYEFNLGLIVERVGDDGYVWHATAGQRCAAMVKVMDEEVEHG